MNDDPHPQLNKRPQSGVRGVFVRIAGVFRAQWRILSRRFIWFCSYLLPIGGALFIVGLGVLLFLAAGEKASDQTWPIALFALTAWTFIGIAGARPYVKTTDPESPESGKWSWRAPVGRPTVIGLVACIVLVSAEALHFTIQSVLSQIVELQILLPIVRGISIELALFLTMATVALTGWHLVTLVTRLMRRSLRLGSSNRRRFDQANIYLCATILYFATLLFLLAYGRTSTRIDINLVTLTTFGVLLVALATVSRDLIREHPKPMLRLVASHFGTLVAFSFFPVILVFSSSQLMRSFESLSFIRLLALFGYDEPQVLMSLGVVCIVLAILARLQRDLVQKTEIASGAALSIYTDAARYNDEEGYAARLERHIRHNDGGVIGVTGLRGAGKSALLANTLLRFEKTHRTMWVTAPIRHEHGYAFLMSICRHLARKVLDDASRALQGQDRPAVRAIGHWFLNSRWLFAAAILLVLLFSQDWFSASGTASKVDISLSAPARISNGADQIWVDTSSSDWEFVKNRFETLLLREREVIGDFVRKIDEAVETTKKPEPSGNEANDSPQQNSQFIIGPIAQRTGIDFVKTSEHIGKSELLRRLKQWSNVDQRLYEPELIWRVDFGRIYLHAKDKSEPFSIRRVVRPDQQGNHRLSLIGHAFLHHHIIGKESFHGKLPQSWRISGSRFYFVPAREFDATVIAAQMLRGYPAIESHLEALSQRLLNLLNFKSVALGRTALASEVFLQAFAETWDKGGVTVTESKLPELKSILTEYLDVLAGNTLFNPSVAVRPKNEPEPWMRNVTKFAADNSILLLLLALVAAGPFLMRALNVMVRGLVNYPLLGLASRSEQVLEHLNYSEGRETSAGLSVKGFSVSEKRKLQARGITLQSLTDTFLGYVRDILPFYNGKLIVVIDELDKVTDPHQVREVLLELKGALFEKGCYYLISVSEDAVRAFRSRLSGGRDIIESTFDDIIEIGQMSPAAAEVMVRSRLKTAEFSGRLSDESILLITVVSGAVPREIIRHVRETVLDSGSDTDTAPRSLGLQLFREELTIWMRRIKESPYRGDEIVSIHKSAMQILEVLDSDPTGTAWPDEIGSHLGQIMNVLDSEKKRMSCVPGLAETESDSADGNADLPKNQIAKRKLSEIQTCLRLLILDCVLQDLYSESPAWQVHADELIRCIRTVQTQPALAETMLESLKVKLFGTPGSPARKPQKTKSKPAESKSRTPASA